MAEREGFEPSKGYKPLLVFKTSAFNRSATSPVSGFAPRIVLGLALVFNRESNACAICWSEVLYDQEIIVIFFREKIFIILK